MQVQEGEEGEQLREEGEQLRAEGVEEEGLLLVEGVEEAEQQKEHVKVAELLKVEAVVPH